jgi:hypothetical protein
MKHHSQNPLTKHIVPVWSICCDECAVREMLRGNLDEVAEQAECSGYRELDGKSLCRVCYDKAIANETHKE